MEMKKPMILITVLALIVTQVGCTSFQRIPPLHPQSHTKRCLDPKKAYRIKTTSGKEYHTGKKDEYLKGFQCKEQALVIKRNFHEDITLPYDKIASIEERKFNKRKTVTVTVATIASVIVAMLVTLGVFVANFDIPSD